jgi:hypothetical protein
MEGRSRIIVRIEFYAPDPKALKRVQSYVTHNVTRAVQRVVGDLSIGFYDWTGHRMVSVITGTSMQEPPETIPVENDLPPTKEN